MLSVIMIILMVQLAVLISMAFLYLGQTGEILGLFIIGFIGLFIAVALSLWLALDLVPSNIQWR